jgi:hypothetical protein
VFTYAGLRTGDAVHGSQVNEISAAIAGTIVAGSMKRTNRRTDRAVRT